VQLIVLKYSLLGLLLVFSNSSGDKVSHVNRCRAGIKTESLESEQASLRRQVPDLVGLRLSDAIQRLKNEKLNVGLIVADDSVKTAYLSELIVFLQNPKPFTEGGAPWTVKKGQQVDIWVTDRQQKVDSARKSK